MELVQSNRPQQTEELQSGEIELSENESIKEESVLTDGISEESVENFHDKEQSVGCPLSGMGCDWSGTSEDLNKHLEVCKSSLMSAPPEDRVQANSVCTSEAVNKLTELLSNIDSVVKQHNTQIQRLQEENKHLTLMYHNLDTSYRCVQQENRQLREQLRRQGRRVIGRVSEVEQGHRRLCELNRRTICELETHVRRKKILPGEASLVNLENGIVWKVEGVEALLEGNKDVWGPCFYLRDYKFQVNISASIVKGFLSFYVALVKGLHDDELEWPFQGEFVFMLDNKENERDVFRKEFVNTSRQANENFRKPKEMKNVPIGYPKFITIEHLKQEKYTMDDSIELRVLVNQIGKHSID